MNSDIVDVPSPIDFLSPDDAKAWESTAMSRPFRQDFFAAFTACLAAMPGGQLTVLDLGSGPGFLALHLLEKLPRLKLDLLDYSTAMHELAATRLAAFRDRVRFVERDFKSENWTEGLGSYDAIVTIQAVHELRHKQYADAFHCAVAGLLKMGGLYLMCDHYCGEGGMSDNQLYMSLDEHRASLAQAGFEAGEVLNKGGRVLYSCRNGKQLKSR